MQKRLRSVFSESPKQLCCAGRFFCHNIAYACFFARSTILFAILAKTAKGEFGIKKNKNKRRAGYGTNTLYFVLVVKIARGSETAYENTLFVLPRERRMYIVTSTNSV